MTTALFIERDASYVNVVRKLRGTMTREEWEHPGYRQAALDAAWTKALAGIREWDASASLVSPLPVTLYLSPVTGAVLVADIRRTANQPIWISATGANHLIPPVMPSGTIIKRTSYAKWCEGPLPHISPDMLDAPTPEQDPEVQRLMAQNSALRDALQSQFTPANYAPLPRQYDPMSSLDLVDFRFRGVFRVRDFQVLDSKQATSAKLKTSDGMLDLGEDGIAV